LPGLSGHRSERQNEDERGHDFPLSARLPGQPGRQRPAGKAADTPAVRFTIHGPGGKAAQEARFSLTHFSMPSGPDEPITALFDLSVDDIDDVRGTREPVDQIGEHSADGGCGDWQSVGAHGRISLDRLRQGVARHLNDHLLLASKWVFSQPPGIELELWLEKNDRAAVHSSTAPPARPFEALSSGTTRTKASASSSWPTVPAMHSFM
jgi:hypothetical protein